MFEDVSVPQPGSGAPPVATPQPVVPLPSIPQPSPMPHGSLVKMIGGIVAGVVALGVLGAAGYWGYMKFTTPPEPVAPPTEIEPEVAPEEVPVVTPPPVQTVSDDADQDGLKDDEEKALGTDPTNPDTDGDGLSDFDEVKIYRTNPLVKDTDGDGYADGEEVKNGYNPNGEGKLLNFELEKVKTDAAGMP